ncbi:MAG: hypothetical protein ACREDK_09615, partial [Thermoplasmata archaeon]
MQSAASEQLVRQAYAYRVSPEAEEYGLLLLTTARLVFRVQESNVIEDRVHIGLEYIGNVLVSPPAYGPPCVQVYSSIGATQFRVEDPVGWAQTIVNARAALYHRSAPLAPAAPRPPPSGATPPSAATPGAAATSAPGGESASGFCVKCGQAR